MEKLIRAILWIAGLLAVLGLIGRLVAFKVWQIPSDPTLAASIAPTLDAGDTVLVLFRGTPGFGDLVRCTDPEDPTKYIIGRIAGLDHDVVEAEGRSLLVNNQRYENESVCDEQTHQVAHPTTGSMVDLRCDIVKMGGGWHYRGFSATEERPSKVRKEVPGGQLFLISDDRTYHDDSRDYGTVPASSCTERIVFRITGKGGWSDEKARMTFIH
jgi:signal peptidase I